MSPKLSDVLLPPLILFLSFNVLILNLVVFSRHAEQAAVTVESVTPTVTPSASLTPTASPSPTAIPLPVTKLSITPTGIPGVKEIYIPLGTGRTTNNEWEELPATEVAVNTANYPIISKVYFEVFMHITTGNGTMQAKLYNSTDRHDVWFSEVSMTGDRVTRLEVPISLDAGNKRYKVMVKSSLKAEAVVDNARIKIQFK